MPQIWELIVLFKKKEKKKKKLDANIDLVLHTGFENSLDCVDDFVVDIKWSNLADVIAEKSFDGSQDNESSECFKCPLEKVILSLGNSFIPLA